MVDQEIGSSTGDIREVYCGTAHDADAPGMQRKGREIFQALLDDGEIAFFAQITHVGNRRFERGRLRDRDSCSI